MLEPSGVKQAAGDVLMKFMAEKKNRNQSVPEYSIGTIPQPIRAPALTSASPKTFDDVNEPVLSDKYNMNHECRGCFIILNHNSYDSKLSLQNRVGSEVDYNALENTAKILGFEYVRTFHDLTKRQIEKLLKKIAQADHSNYDCLAVVVLTHGKVNDQLYAKDQIYHLDTLTDPFVATECNSLAGKPKLFFIQACRGEDVVRPYKLTYPKGADIVDTDSFVDDHVQTVIIPNSADFLLAFSTIPGHYAWKNPEKGSYFIQALCKCFNRFGSKMELMQIMTRVNQIVAIEFEANCSDSPKVHQTKQIPSIVTRLIHDVYFPSKATVCVPEKHTYNRPAFKETHL